MPYDDPDPDDPHVLVGVALAGDEASAREMAEAIAEEFARMGFDRERVLRLFRTPFYAGAHAVWRALGDEEITHLVDEAQAVWGTFRQEVRDAVDEQTHVLKLIR